MSNAQTKIQETRQRRTGRTRSQIHGTATKPRLTVMRSLRYLAVQAIDDDTGRTLLGVHESKLVLQGTKSERAEKFGQEIGSRLQAAGIKKIVFDKGPYKYHGRIKIMADALRGAGIQF
ncbi:MAG: 50S ribosomal protein L18 [Candidatus Komeilibacteria bacterium]|nr:50S ribosomal protein L18 [Candidatus Komeilibacteria bacterium]